jgi:hypothetical protein
MKPTTFQRLYVGGACEEYPADDVKVAAVLRSMNEHSAGPDPFRVRVRFEDKSSVVVAPKRRR